MSSWARARARASIRTVDLVSYQCGPRRALMARIKYVRTSFLLMVYPRVTSNLDCSSSEN
jgi:hypothetical protein